MRHIGWQLVGVIFSQTLFKVLYFRKESHVHTEEFNAVPAEELVLELTDPQIQLETGERRATATAILRYETADRSRIRNIESRIFSFKAPLGPIEFDDLKWYLERYYLWPSGVFTERAQRVEAQLPTWGYELYQAALEDPAAKETVNAWLANTGASQRRFSVMVDTQVRTGATEESQKAADEAATVLLSLPWELVHNGQDYMFLGSESVSVRRRLPNHHSLNVTQNTLPIRILLVSPRPEDDMAGYIDHRASAGPLMDAVENLGELVEVRVLMPPTLPALRQELERAKEAGMDFDVVHFDGHGVYDARRGQGALVFEDPADIQRLHNRSSLLVYAEELSEVMKEHGIPLVFLDACQSAMSGEDPTASVAAKLLEQDVSSVVAMSHSVLVETTRRFVEAFYMELTRGSTVGKAMLEGQKTLKENSYRMEVVGAGELRLQDWFVPVLYQQENDQQLMTRLPSQVAEQVEQIVGRAARPTLGELPESPPHSFVGRSRELLALERLLQQSSYCVVQGQGGIGKTAVAVELARWLVRTDRHQQAAFVNLEEHREARSVVDSLGRQLLSAGWSVAHYPDLNEALQHVERALSDTSTIIVLDNMESVLPGQGRGVDSSTQEAIDELFWMCNRIEEAGDGTRIVFTSRDPLPEPYDNGNNAVRLGALKRDEAIEMVGRVLVGQGLSLSPTDPGMSEEEVEELVEAVGRHARALVLLAPEVARRGVRATTGELQELMAKLDRDYPGERENSLYASVELSLRRMSEETRELVKGLGVFYGGGYIPNMAHVIGVEREKADALVVELITVGLGRYMGHVYVRLDPALPAYLLRDMDEEEEERLRARWVDAIRDLIHYLYGQQFEDAEVASLLTELELPNLLAMLEWGEGHEGHEEVANLASMVEQLVSTLGRPRALAQIVGVRQRAQQTLESLGEWSRARFETARVAAERLFEEGKIEAAREVARELLQQSLKGGEEAYEGADYNIAMAHHLLGRVLLLMRAAEEALGYLEDARRLFQVLADAGNTSAEYMVATAATEIGGQLKELGRLDEAEQIYRESIKHDERVGDRRGAAVSKGNLGAILMLQGRYQEALEALIEAREVFEALGEPRSVGTFWHQTGMVYRDTGQHDQAEEAFRNALRIRVQQGDRQGEADTLTVLGLLYGDMGRHEEAVTFQRQAVDVYVELKDLGGEGLARNNLALALYDLGRYEEARREIQRAIECDKPFGHAAKAWATWDILSEIERGDGRSWEAAQARQNAIQSYLEYRRAGGVSQSPLAEAFAQATQSIEQGDTAELVEELLQFMDTEDIEVEDEVALSKLVAILRGNGVPALAGDPGLDYVDAAELLLLLEALEAKVDWDRRSL